MSGNNLTSKPQQVTDKTFDTFISHNRVVVVDFWADWCFPCHMLSPVLEALTNEHQHVAFGKLNVDENRETATRYDIMSIPTLLYFKDGRLVDKTIGVVPKKTIEDQLTKLSL
ncbi:MAG: thioredoxin [Candidatus Ranarchaeia archaeon]|jgi:thioredoxin 1